MRWLLESIRGYVLRLPGLREAEAAAQRDVATTAKAVAEHRSLLDDAVRDRQAKEQSQLTAHGEVAEHLAIKPGFSPAFFRRRKRGSGRRKTAGS